jgi:hypothetical protein
LHNKYQYNNEAADDDDDDDDDDNNNNGKGQAKLSLCLTKYHAMKTCPSLN